MNKWLTASVVDDAAPVISDVFDEAERRDPYHRRTCVALVDGNKHQIDCIEAQVLKRKLDVTVLIDLIYVWNICGRPRGASSVRGTLAPRPGYTPGHWPSSTEGPATWRRGSAGALPAMGSRRRLAKVPMTVPST